MAADFASALVQVMTDSKTGIRIPGLDPVLGSSVCQGRAADVPDV